MKKSDVMIVAAITGLLGLAASPAATAADKADREQCYGVAKAGKNDCHTADLACAGTAKQDGQKDAWIYLPKGACEKIVGGSLEPGKTAGS